eukprot:SAG31_NODE_39038_length_291_cov_1.010417_1_plen_33_part_10
MADKTASEHIALEVNVVRDIAINVKSQDAKNAV